MKIDIGELRARLLRLQWGDGLTAAEIRAQATDLPQSLLRQLPADYRFRNAGEVTSFVHHLLENGLLPGDPDISPVMEPSGFGNSPTGQTFHTFNTRHGVGSGAGSGYTGSDAETGDSREGVDYTAQE